MRVRIGYPCWRLWRPFGGVARYLLNLLREARRLWPEAEWILYSEEAPPPLPQRPWSHWRWVHLRWGENNLTWNLWAFPQSAHRDSLHLIHNPNYILPPWLPAPAVVTIHDVSYLAHPEWFSPKAYWFYRLFTAIAIRRARYVLTASQFSRQEIMHYCSIGPERVVVTPYGLEASFFSRSLQRVHPVREQYGLEHPYLLFVGATLRRRHVELVVEALGRWHPLGEEPWLFVVAGPEGNGEEALWQEIERWGLQERVRRLPFVPEEDLPALYAGARVFVYPSEYEGFGLPVLEAMGAGVPVVAAHHASLPEVVGDVGWLVELKGEAIAEALHRLWHDEALRQAMGERARERARGFSWAATAEKTLAVYEKVLRDR